MTTAEVGTVTLPMTESQRGLLVVNGSVPAPEIYNQLARIDLRPEVPAAAVAPAVSVLVAVQPALRQVFEVLPEMRARLRPPDAVPVETLEVPADRYEAELAALAERLGRPGFDLATGPAYRFGHVRAADGSASAVLLCAHHIVGDGLSIGPIVRDLDAALAGTLAEGAVETLRRGREAALEREAAAQLRSAGTDRTGERVAAWAEQLRAVPPLVLNPRPNRPVRTAFTGERVSWLLSGDESAALQATAKRLAATPFMLLTGLYGAVLARHGGVGTVLVGSPFSARRTIGAFDLCGFFVNTLPVTVPVDWNLSLDEHVTGPVRAAVDHCKAHVDVPFTQLVAQVQPDRPADRNPLFSAMLVMQDTVVEGVGAAVLGVSEPGNGTAKFDLWLGATPVDGRWLLELEYDRELIPPGVADGLLGSLRTAVRRGLADGSLPLRSLFADASLAESLRTDGWPARADEFLVGWFDRVAAADPAAVAVDSLTYGELAEASRRVAAGLRGHGVDGGSVVGLVLDDLAGTVTAILAVLRCGAAYLPLDPALPGERLAYMVSQAECRLIVGPLEVAGATSVPLSTVDGGPGAGGPEVADPGHPGYVMFTSGSTGRPKGVRMGSGPLLNLSAWQIAALGMDAGTRFLQYAPLGFDVSFQEILPTLLAGGTVLGRAGVDRRDFPALLRRLADTGATHVYLPVAALRPLVQSARAARVRLPALRRLCVSGEQLMVDDDIREFFVEHPHVRLVNLYGPTETHAVTTHELSGADADWPAHVPIGLPLAGVAAYVVDGTGHLAPPGVPGELLLGGACVADGYVRDPERTAAAFVEDRFAGAGRAYRSGDLVVRDERGTLVFLGRDDTQVKVRGHRIELGEIETVANRVPGVRLAVALARGPGADRALVLMLVAEPGAAVDVEQVRAELVRTLPAYMEPRWVFEVPAVPTSAMGKTDRTALAAVAEQRIAAEQRPTDGAQPAGHADELERRLAAIWAGVLGVPEVLRDVPVLRYGAHSLTIFTALAQVQQECGVAVPLVDFFRTPTVAALARLVRAGDEG